MTSVVWSTRQGHRRIEHVRCAEGDFFKVTDPRTVVQAPDTLGWVPVFYRTIKVSGTPKRVFSDVTINGLKVLGVDIADIVAEPPKATPAPVRGFPRTTLQPGETVSDLNQRRYRVFWQTIRAGMAEVKAGAAS